MRLESSVRESRYPVLRITKVVAEGKGIIARWGLKEAGIVIPPEPGIESLCSYNGLLAASREHASKKSKGKTTVSTFANILDNAIEKDTALNFKVFFAICVI